MTPIYFLLKKVCFTSLLTCYIFFCFLKNIFKCYSTQKNLYGFNWNIFNETGFNLVSMIRLLMVSRRFQLIRLIDAAQSSLWDCSMKLVSIWFPYGFNDPSPDGLLKVSIDPFHWCCSEPALKPLNEIGFNLVSLKLLRNGSLKLNGNQALVHNYATRCSHQQPINHLLTIKD